MRQTVFVVAMSLAFAISPALRAQQAQDPRVADLVQSGRLRAGVGVVAAHWASKDPATGELRGVAIDLARALAARLGVELVPVEYPSPPAVLDGLKTGAWDVGFLGVDPARTTLVDFSPPYLQIDATYLVLAGSSISNIAGADQPGVRIAVSRNSVEDIVLSRTLKQAELIRSESVGAGFELLRAGSAHVLAAPHPSLVALSARLPGSRLLDGRFHATFAAIAVPKGQATRLAYVSEFVEEAKASGLVQRAIERAGVRGVHPVPAGNAGTR